MRACRVYPIRKFRNGQMTLARASVISPTLKVGSNSCRWAANGIDRSSRAIAKPESYSFSLPSVGTNREQRASCQAVMRQAKAHRAYSKLRASLRSKLEIAYLWTLPTRSGRHIWPVVFENLRLLNVHNEGAKQSYAEGCRRRAEHVWLCMHVTAGCFLKTRENQRLPSKRVSDA